MIPGLFHRGVAALACALWLSVPGPAAALDAPAAPALRADGRVQWATADSTGVATPGQDVFRGASSALANWVVAERRLAAGDSLGADSLLGAPELARSVWAWRALRRRTELALAQRDTLRASRGLDAADRATWPEGDRAAWLLERSRCSLWLGDTTAAIEFARQQIQVYPSLGPAGTAVSQLTAWTRARGESLSVADERAAAEVDFFRTLRASAATRLRRVLARCPATERSEVAVRLAEVLRASRTPRAALGAADQALRAARDAESRARAQLERARALRDAAATDSALSLYRAIARTAPSASARATAWWELAREAQDRSRWSQAQAAFEEVVRSGDRRAEDARFLAGLMAYTQGDHAAARGAWRSGASEASRFWHGIVMRGVDRAASDSVLSALAARPGYTFYRAAARDTLGRRGWPGTIATERCVADTLCAALEGVDQLFAAGRPEDAGFLLSRFAAADARLVPSGRRIDAGQWLAATRIAYASGNTSLGTRYSERAFASAGEQDSLAWSVVPWAYPPAFEAAVRGEESLGVEPALLWALMRQESRFDPRARSRSDALGLAQLKLATAGDVARWLREPAPTVERLFEPERGVRYGARYLRHLLQRFDGHAAVALAAYNAGPGTIRRDWRELLARGGGALFCELASNADSQDYARRILGMRQAYRELAPTSVR